MFTMCYSAMWLIYPFNSPVERRYLSSLCYWWGKSGAERLRNLPTARCVARLAFEGWPNRSPCSWPASILAQSLGNAALDYFAGTVMCCCSWVTRCQAASVSLSPTSKLLGLEGTFGVIKVHLLPALQALWQSSQWPFGFCLNVS